MSKDAGRPRILVVDDEPGMLRAVARVLGRMFDTATCESAMESAALAEAFRPDVAILDIRMPEMNGFELMCRLREKQPGLDVILMTGDAEDPEASLVRAIDDGAFYFIQKPFDRRVLLALVSRCVELRRLREEKQRYVKQLENELEAARRFQRSLLPADELQSHGVSIAARFVPCTQLAGDFVDYAAVGSNALAFIIADVAGHGASAAMLTGVLKSAFHAAHAEQFDPMSVTNRVRAGMSAFDGGRFVTLCCARLDTETRQLVYVNAGHPPPILHGPKREVRLLHPTGPLLSSMLADLPCEASQVTLHADDRLLFYTDGVTDAEGSQGHFGRDRVLSIVSESRGSAGETLDKLLHAVAEFVEARPTRDDMTLLATEFASPRPR